MPTAVNPTATSHFGLDVVAKPDKLRVGRRELPVHLANLKAKSHWESISLATGGIKE